MNSTTTKFSFPGLWKNDRFRGLLPQPWTTMQKSIVDAFPAPHYFDISPKSTRDALMSMYDKEALRAKGMYVRYLEHPEEFPSVRCSMCADTPDTIYVHTEGRYNESIGLVISLLIPGRIVEYAWSSESADGGHGVWRDGEITTFCELNNRRIHHDK